jgi:hypothetical protein
MKRYAATLLFLFTVLTLCGCTIDINVIVHPDNTATISAEFVELAESTDFIRRIPNMADYLDAWMRSLREDGVLFDLSYEGEDEHIYMQRRVQNLRELSSPQELPGGVRTWTLAERTDEGQVATYRYCAVLDTTIFYGTAPGADANVTAEVHKQLDDVTMTYSVTLPGQITYTNADSVHYNRATWNVPMKALIEIVAESRAEASTPAQPGSQVPLGAWGVLGLLVGLGILGLLICLVLGKRSSA